MKTIEPAKLIVNINESGGLASAVFQYKVNEDGTKSKIKSVSVTSSVSGEGIATIIAGAKASAETSEGL